LLIGTLAVLGITHCLPKSRRLRRDTD
jgi:hypothetical protein